MMLKVEEETGPDTEGTRSSQRFIFNHRVKGAVLCAVLKHNPVTVLHSVVIKYYIYQIDFATEHLEIELLSL